MTGKEGRASINVTGANVWRAGGGLRIIREAGRGFSRLFFMTPGGAPGLMATKEDYYKILGVPREAGEDEIKKAYRKMAMAYHPDRAGGDAEAVQKFKDASEAYEVLRDPEKRRLYDSYGHEGLDRSGFRGFTNVDDVFTSFGDIFADFFGGGVFGDMGRTAQRARRGASLRVALEITLREAARGVTKTIELTRHESCHTCKGTGSTDGSAPAACSYCRGRGRVIQSQGWVRVSTTCPRCRGEGKVVASPCKKCDGTGLAQGRQEIEIKIPAGIESGQQIRQKGQGDHGGHGMPPGDLYVQVYVKEHALFRREGRELVFEMPISFTQAALGDEIEVPTIWGKAGLKIPAGIQSGSPIRLGGEGMPDVEGGRRGDQVVVVYVETPRKLTARQKEILKEFAASDDLKATPERKNFFDKVKDYFQHES